MSLAGLLLQGRMGKLSRAMAYRGDDVRLNKQKWTMMAGAVSAFALAAGVNQAKAQAVVPCPAAIVHCVHSVSGWCEKDNGKISVIYYDKAMTAEIFHQCVGKVLEKAGRPNPYAPPSQQKAAPKR